MKKKITVILVMPVLPSLAGIMPLTEKNLLVTNFLVKFCFIQN